MRLPLTALLLLVCILDASALAEPKWVWSPRNKDDASNQPTFFRKTFELGEPDVTKGASKAEIAADNTYILFINGKRVGAGNNWQEGQLYDISALLVKGENTIAVEANSGDAMAGLFARITIKTKDGKTHDVSTDKTWKSSLTPKLKWEQAKFDDKGWEAAHEFGPLKVAPWNGNTTFSDKPKTGTWDPAATKQVDIQGTFIAQKPHGPWTFDLKDGDRVVLLGATFIEREGQLGYIETALTSRYPDRNLTFRNLGWSGDTVLGEARARFGDQREGFSHLTKFLRGANPTVILVAYGHNESFSGEAGLPKFLDGLNKLLPVLEETGARIAFITPHQLENLGAPLPDHKQQNENIYAYTDAITKVASSRGFPLFNLFVMPPCKACAVDSGAAGEANSTEPPMKPSKEVRLTDNGLHLTDVGYWHVAHTLLAQIDPAAARWRMHLKADGSVVAGGGAKVSNAKAADGGLTFDLLDDSLPLNVAGGVPNPQRTVAIDGLKAGKYELRIDGKPAASANSGGPATRTWFVLSQGPQFDQSEQLRQTILKKNELFFHYWRPQNETYIFLFRKHEQGNNAVEMPQFIPLVEAQEKVIAELRRPKTHSYAIVLVK